MSMYRSELPQKDTLLQYMKLKIIVKKVVFDIFKIMSADTYISLRSLVFDAKRNSVTNLL